MFPLKGGGDWTAFKLLACALYTSLRVYYLLMCTPAKKGGAQGKKGGALRKKMGATPPFPPLGGTLMYQYIKSRLTYNYRGL